MSYHFYDMGFKDGYKKALQQLDEQRGGMGGGMNVLPGDVQTGPGGGMRPVSKIAGNFPSRAGGTNRRTAAVDNQDVSLDPEAAPSFPAQFPTDGFAYPPTQFTSPPNWDQFPPGFKDKYWNDRPGSGGRLGFWDVPLDADLNGDGRLSAEEFRRWIQSFRTPPGIGGSGMPMM